jgi:hypothetical protein
MLPNRALRVGFRILALFSLLLAAARAQARAEQMFASMLTTPATADCLLRD